LLAGSVVTLAGRLEDESVAVLVEDHGPGVPAEAEPHIFKMHTSAREQRHTPAGQVATRQGHGVGLAICRSIMQSHQGDVFYEPTSGGGATFVLRFPRAGGCDVEER
jgi:signal transduction histidine kinase